MFLPWKILLSLKNIMTKGENEMYTMLRMRKADGKVVVLLDYRGTLIEVGYLGEVQCDVDYMVQEAKAYLKFKEKEDEKSKT